MQTQLSPAYRATAKGQEADAILRSCVHCGFCNATCPTYQLLGDELDGPRGRIYQIKQVLEGIPASTTTRLHLDRCLTCRACETTCPSGVNYSRLLEIGRERVEQDTERSRLEKLQRWALLKLLPYPRRLHALLRLAYGTRFVLPPRLKRKLPAKQTASQWPQAKQTRTMLAFDGCVQSVTTPNTNAASARVLQSLGIQLLQVPQAACCGAANLHLSDAAAARAFMRRNIDAWWPFIEAGAEAIVVSASGCGVMVKDYASYFQDEPHYAAKAEKISALAKDLSEVIQAELNKQILATNQDTPRKIAFHNPCTLQHGQGLSTTVENILRRVGFELVPVADAHLCCGSAGTYSLLQAKLSQQLLSDKLKHLQAQQPSLIATANIGCQLHLATQADVPVVHWIELLDQVLLSQNPAPEQALGVG